MVIGQGKSQLIKGEIFADHVDLARKSAIHRVLWRSVFVVKSLDIGVGSERRLVVQYKLTYNVLT